MPVFRAHHLWITTPVSLLVFLLLTVQNCYVGEWNREGGDTVSFCIVERARKLKHLQPLHK